MSQLLSKINIHIEKIVAFLANTRARGPFAVLQLGSTIIVGWWVLSRLRTNLQLVYGYGVWKSAGMLYNDIASSVFKVILSLPPVKARVDKQLRVASDHMEKELIRNAASLRQFPQLPTAGVDQTAILEELDLLHADLAHSDWANGRVSGAVYHGGSNLLLLQSDAYHKNAVANQLHPDVFPGVRKMEAEVVSMVLKLFHGDEALGFCGSTTLGGTESLILAVLAAREYAKRHRRVTRPEVIAPVTVHAGIDKACYYFGITLHKVDVDPQTYQANLRQVKRLINGNTVLLVGSAPNYPHGIIDDIEGLGLLAVRYAIPLHVDACLGSFIVAFLEKSKVHGDRPLPVFDFRVAGVTSISCDTHKYGFAPKGSSIIMYRDLALRECQYYIQPDWTGGIYGSPTLAGSRPGALMAGCWATLVNIGEEGYKKSCYDIVSSTMRLKNAIVDGIPQLAVLGDPIGPVVAFEVAKPYRDQLNIYNLSDALGKKGWHFATLQNPPGLHFAFTRLTVPIVDELIADVKQVVSDALSGAEHAVSATGSAAIYGVAGSVQTAGVADRIIVAFLDTLYKVKPSEAQ